MYLPLAVQLVRQGLRMRLGPILLEETLVKGSLSYTPLNVVVGWKGKLTVSG